MNIKEKTNIIQHYTGPKLRIMEVCGTHTHENFRLGIRSILPENIELISGPGCPVCVTPSAFIDEALLLALEHGATVCTFGDLLRVPGSEMSLLDARARGARVRPVYSAMDAYDYAQEHRAEQVVFLSVGFETTTPSACITVRLAAENQIKNYSLLTANKTMDNAYRAMKDSADAFLYPGHVCTITGTGICRQLMDEGISGVVAGFAAEELIDAFAEIIACSNNRPFFKNRYPAVVSDEGNPLARQAVNAVMKPCDARWRGLGIIPDSGLTLREEYQAWDARVRFALPAIENRDPAGCRCGDVLQGKCTPNQCPLFGRTCRPAHPIGACMVSSEGACAAYYQYGGVTSFAE